MHICRDNSVRLLVDKWLTLPDRPVSEGNKKEGGSRGGEGRKREGGRDGEGSRCDGVKGGRGERGGESDKERQRERETEGQ